MVPNRANRFRLGLRTNQGLNKMNKVDKLLERKRPKIKSLRSTARHHPSLPAAQLPLRHRAPSPIAGQPVGWDRQNSKEVIQRLQRY